MRHHGQPATASRRREKARERGRGRGRRKRTTGNRRCGCGAPVQMQFSNTLPAIYRNYTVCTAHITHHFAPQPMACHVLTYTAIVTSSSHEYPIDSQALFPVCREEISGPLHKRQVAKPAPLGPPLIWGYIAGIVYPGCGVSDHDGICMPICHPPVMNLPGLRVVFLDPQIDRLSSSATPDWDALPQERG